MQLIAALGPLVSNHCLLASNRHHRSFADAIVDEPRIVNELTILREHLERKLGPILMTEHGRVPVCIDDQDQHEDHCFHAHVTFFPNAETIVPNASSYYRRARTFNSLKTALTTASTVEEYLLISESSSVFHVLDGPVHVPRQLARSLVAHQFEKDLVADWRLEPNAEQVNINTISLTESMCDFNDR